MKSKYKVTVYFLLETYNKHRKLVHRWFKFASYYFITKKYALRCVKLHSSYGEMKATIEKI